MTNVTCQFSIYPLGVANLGTYLDAALDSVRSRGLEPEVGMMSNMVAGPLDEVMSAMAAAFDAAAAGGCVMVLTVSNACAVPAVLP